MIYLNENDPSAIAWLKELMKAGAIPDGHIDTRSIVDVRPEELSGFDQCHFFAGIAGWPLALRMAGYEHVKGLWTGSCPCQPFSAAGKRKGTSDARHLWPEMRRLVEQCRPAIVLGEQVASKDGRSWCAGVRADMEALGYAFGAADLCAAGVGAPHIRQRLYWGGRRLEYPTGEQVGIPGQPREQRDSGGLEHTQSNGRQQRWAITGERGAECGRGESDRLGDAEGGRREGKPVHTNRDSAVRVAQADAGGMAKSERTGVRMPRCGTDAGAPQGVQGEDWQRQRIRPDTGTSGNVECSRMADANQQQQHGLGDTGPRGRGELADGGRLGGANNPGSQGHGDTGERTRELSPWSPSTLIHCADGKTRRICPEPGVFPLAHGVPGRVGLLRGYGNAIVPQLAAIFVESFIGATVET